MVKIKYTDKLGKSMAKKKNYVLDVRKKKVEPCCDDHKEKVGIIDDKANELIPAVENKAMSNAFQKWTKQFHTLGDATFCATCKANTNYKGLCAVCGIKSEEIRAKHNGNLEYLRAHYSNHVNVA
jgi:hypothetical protein